jgi:hypothetical protein
LAAGWIGASSARAQDGDTIEGAVWVFDMKAKGPRADTLRGRFRVSDNVLYQQSERSRTAPFDKEVGRNHPTGRKTGKTVVELEDLRAVNQDGEIQTGLKGKIRMSLERFGEWKGVFTDSDGRNWDFKCSRVRE